MKCPCCNRFWERPDYFVYDNKLYCPDGSTVSQPGGPMYILQTLLRGGPFVIPEERKPAATAHVNLSKLRGFISDLGLPFQIARTEARTYILVRKDVKNNNVTEHSQDVHS